MPLDEDTGFKYIVVGVNHFTKFMWASGSESKDSTCVLNFLRQHFTGDLPFDILHTDNGGEFINDELASFCSQVSSRHVTGAPRHPQSQGCVERVNQTLKQSLNKARPATDKCRWVRWLDFVVNDYNNSEHSSIGTCPVIAEKGTFPPPLSEAEKQQQLEYPLPSLSDITSAVSTSLVQSANNFVTTYQKSGRVYSFTVGERVLVKKFILPLSQTDNLPLWPFEGRITNISANNCFKLRWETQGPKPGDEPGSLSGWIPSRHLKPIPNSTVSRTLPHSDMCDALFVTPPRQTIRFFPSFPFPLLTLFI